MQYSTRKHLCRGLFLLKLQYLQLYLKETTTQEFCCEYFEIFNISFFIEIVWWLLLLRGNWRKVTQVKQKCQMSTNLSKMLTCCLILFYLLKRCLLKKLFWKPPPMFPCEPLEFVRTAILKNNLGQLLLYCGSINISLYYIVNIINIGP